ncbi:MAG: ABC-2 family transporter protein [Lachnospiraceae bacterium]|nr:ABC-2 family transporter protein [Lachnospiraceae bacterium]MDE6186326.1 ABC-2 family transporter protein [Lachnospiraceae bacterium]MDE7285760.1 ABC-2 family transporter protein [Lachnospiraceae bacterium]
MKAYLFVTKIRIQSALAYRFNVISTILIQCLLMFAMACFWRAAYSGTEAVSGVGKQDMLTYTMISVIMGNLMTMGVEGRIQSSVHSGSVALDMLKPVSIYGIYLAEDLGDMVVAFFQIAVPLFLLGTAMFGFPIPASTGHFILFLLTFCIGYLINWMLAALLGMCAFKIISMGPIRNVKGAIMKLLSGSIIPLWFFPAGFRTFLEFLPFVNIYQLPLGIYIGRYTYGEMLQRTGLQLFWCMALWLIFNIAQKKAAAVVLIQGG